MKTPIIISFCVLMVFMSCSDEKSDKVSETEIKSDKFFQYSIWWAFVNKVFDGDLKVSELKKQGDIGLGSFDFLDGELVMLNGTPYRIREDGEISVGEDNDEIVYANATFFDEDGTFKLENPVDYIDFKAQLDSLMPNENYFYAYVAHGTFDAIKLGGVPLVEKPFDEGLDVLLPKRPIFTGENVTGTMVGFYCPKFIGNINAYGYHTHFIADDLKLGGHLLEFKMNSDIEVKYDQITEYQFQLPSNDTYENVTLEKEFQYNK